MSDNPTAPTPPSGVGANWAGNLTYSAGRLLQPTTLKELREHVSGAERIKPVGSRHSFNTIADTHGDMVTLIGMPRIFELDEEARTVTVDAGTRYGDLAAALQSRGWALQNMGLFGPGVGLATRGGPCVEREGGAGALMMCSDETAHLQKDPDPDVREYAPRPCLPNRQDQLLPRLRPLR